MADSCPSCNAALVDGRCPSCAAARGPTSTPPDAAAPELASPTAAEEEPRMRRGFGIRPLPALIALLGLGLFAFAILHGYAQIFAPQEVPQSLLDADRAAPPPLEALAPIAPLELHAAAPKNAAAGSAIVRGRIAWQRVRPPRTLTFLSSDPGCGATVSFSEVPLGDLGGVSEALVVIEPAGGAPPAEPDATPRVATFRGCLPTPRLLAAPPGTKVELRSISATDHRLTSSREVAGLPALLRMGESISTEIPPTGTAVVTDAAHPWERIVLVAVPSAHYARVNQEGFFRIAELPPGPARMIVYTEASGPIERELELAPNGEVTVFLDLSDAFAPKSSPNDAAQAR